MTVTLLVPLSLAAATFLLVRALLIEGKAPRSAWRDATLHRDSAADRKRSTGPRSAGLRSRSMLERGARTLPRLNAPADRLINRAGLSARVTGSWLIGLSLVLGAGALVFWIGSASGNGLSERELMLAPVVTAIGAAFPWLMLSGRAKRRQDTIEKALPDMLDLITVSIEAGLALEGALQRVSERGVGPLAEEIQRTLNEISLGRRRPEALESLAARTQVAPLQSLVNAMNQAERSGMQMGPVLRAQAEQLRTVRRQQAEEKALKAPIKMLFPLAVFIFPSIFLVVMGPAAIHLMESF